MADPARRPRSAVRAAFKALGVTVVALGISRVASIAFLVHTVAVGYDLEATWIVLGATGGGQVGFLA